LDFNEIFEQFGIDPDDIEEAPDPPDFRATMRGRRLMVTSWAPHLFADGPQGNIVRERAENGVTVADLWVTEGEPRELIVGYLAVAERKRADAMLARWAEAVGHSRIWFPDRLLELHSKRPLGTAQVECPNCGGRWSDGSPDFWASVRQMGRFPSLCPICNGDLPQWRWRPAAGERSGSPG